jgi:TonB-dependent receptor
MAICCVCERAKCLTLLAFLLLIFSGNLFAAGSTINGHVYDKTTGEPLIGANIIVVNTSLGAATDVDGKFIIYNVPAGEQKLKVSYIGYVAITVDVTVEENRTVEQDIRLEAQALTGETVVITGQAKGQLEAINQQLSSNTISNIVASDRIKELPDVSAAESIGRLPGISIDRYNGEATAIAIRGLAPKYNLITVNGVALPTTDYDNRTVDLSLISSNALDGIEVKKANTADMDADVLGGTVDLRLKEAPSGFQLNGSLQGGYTKIEKYYGNYSGYVNISNRFLDDKLGIIAGVNVDRNNRSADKLNANWNTDAKVNILTDIKLVNFTVRKETAFKDRVGGNLLFDYVLAKGKFTASGFYSQAKTDGLYRYDNMDFNHQSHYYTLEEDKGSKASIYTGSLGITQDYDKWKFDASISATGSHLYDPDDYQWGFAQENNANQGTPDASEPLSKAYTYERWDSVRAALQQFFQNSRVMFEKQKVAQLNVQAPFRLTDKINGYLKAGGKLRWVSRNFNQESYGKSGYQYGGGWSGGLSDLLHVLAVIDPANYNFQEDSALIRTLNIWPMYRFLRGYKAPADFLGGEYKLGPSPDLALMKEITSVMKNLGGDNWQRQPINSLGQDYDGIEQYQAGYIMAEINLGSHFTLIPGVRYDQDYTKYHGQSFREIVSAANAQPPADYKVNENERANNFLLPMIHLKIRPVDWLRLHLAATETVTRPDYKMYAPITTLDRYSHDLHAANGALRDALAKNLDASLSVYESHLGLITISGYYKQIKDLILYQQIRLMDSTVYNQYQKIGQVNLNIPNLSPSSGWLVTAPNVSTWINNFSPADLRGIEFDWQTNFWYLPSVLKGLVFNLNWSYINSRVEVKSYFQNSFTWADSTAHHNQHTIKYIDSTSRTERLPDQPSHILNMTIGYDYKGFSLRVSYIYQSDKITYISESPITDGFVASYGRWDVAVQQRIGPKVQLYANLNNVNNTHDLSVIGYREINPTSIQYYGRTVDVGVRFNL